MKVPSRCKLARDLFYNFLEKLINYYIILDKNIQNH